MQLPQIRNGALGEDEPLLEPRALQVSIGPPGGRRGRLSGRRLREHEGGGEEQEPQGRGASSRVKWTLHRAIVSSGRGAGDLEPRDLANLGSSWVHGVSGEVSLATLLRSPGHQHQHGRRRRRLRVPVPPCPPPYEEENLP